MIIESLRRGAVIDLSACAFVGLFVIRDWLASRTFINDRVPFVLCDQIDIDGMRNKPESLKRLGHHPRLDSQVVAHRLLKFGVNLVLLALALRFGWLLGSIDPRNDDLP